MTGVAIEVTRKRSALPLFLGALAISKCGDALYLLALPWIAYEWTHSAAAMGMLYAAEVLPIVLGGPLAGVWIDRYGARRTMIASDLARMILVGAIPLLVHFELVKMALLYVIAFFLGLLTLMFDVATTAVIPRLASDLTRANASHQATTQLAAMAGPALAGVVIATVGASGALTIDAISFAATLIIVARQPLFPIAGESQRRSIGAELSDGIRWLWRSGVVRTLALQAAIGNFGFAMVSAVLLFYLRDTLGATATATGVAFAMLGAGGVIGSMIIVPLARRVRKGTLYPVILCVGLTGLLIVASIRSARAAGIGLALVGACNMAWVILSTSVRQESIPTPLLGRVLAVSRALSVAAMPAGAAAGGWIAATVAVETVFLLAALTKLIELMIALRSGMRRL